MSIDWNKPVIDAPVETAEVIEEEIITKPVEEEKAPAQDGDFEQLENNFEKTAKFTVDGEEIIEAIPEPQVDPEETATPDNPTISELPSDNNGIGEFITPEDIAAGKTELKPEQMEMLKKRMANDFTSSDAFMTKEKWNDKHFQAQEKIQHVSAERMFDDTETKENVKTYLKGKFVDPVEKHITWLSKDKLIKKVKVMKPEMKMSELKRIPRKQLLDMVQMPAV
jgi:hypothetical protein